jgi:hypothetical protein
MTKSKLAIALGVVSAIALSMPSAQARTKHHRAKSLESTVTSAPDAYQPFYRGYNYEPAPLMGIGYGEPNGSSNYNRNASQ